MKKIILLALIALMVVGCKEENLKETVRHATESFKNESILRHGMVVDIDSCQYIVCDAYAGWAYVHHNNCRFCKERMKKELEELVIKCKTPLKIIYKDGMTTDTIVIFKDKEK